jgi:hypothetical protein
MKVKVSFYEKNLHKWEESPVYNTKRGKLFKDSHHKDFYTIAYYQNDSGKALEYWAINMVHIDCFDIKKTGRYKTFVKFTEKSNPQEA